MSPIEIRLKAILEAQGAGEASRSVRDLTEALEDYLSVVEAAERNRGERLAQSLQDLGQAAIRSPVFFVDQGRLALEAGDLEGASRLLGRSIAAGEPKALINQLGNRLLMARRNDPSSPPPEEEEEDDWADPRNLRRAGRIETLLERARINGGLNRARAAQSNLQEAQLVLEEIRRSEDNTKALERLTEALNATKKTLDEGRAVGLAGGAPEGEGVDLKGLLGSLTNFGLGRGLGGLPGGLGGLLGRLGGFLGPWGLATLGLGALGGGANLAFRYVSNEARAGREEGLYFLDTGRQLGQEGRIYESFLNAGRNPGLAYASTRRGLAELGYTALEGGQFARALGLPNSGENLYRDTLAGLRLSRYLGADPAEVASLLNAGVRAGAAQGGSIEGLSRVLYEAVREGTKSGVSESETFSSLNRTLEGLAGRGITADLGSAAGLASLLSGLNATGNRGLMGQAGAGQLNNVLGGLAAPGNTGLDILELQAFQGANLSATELGLSGGAARAYEAQRRLGNSYYTSRVAQERLRAANPAAVRALGRALERSLGENPTLEAQVYSELGLSREAIAELQGRYGSVSGFLARGASDAEIRKYLGATPKDLTPGGEAERLGLSAQLQRYQEEEIARLKSLTAALQPFDLQLRDKMLEVFQGVYDGARQAAEGLQLLSPTNLRALIEGTAGPPPPAPANGDPKAAATYGGFQKGLDDVSSIATWINQGAERVGRWIKGQPAPAAGPVFGQSEVAQGPGNAPLFVGRRGFGFMEQLGATARTMEPGERYPERTLQAIARAHGGRLPPWAQGGHNGADFRIGQAGVGDPVYSPWPSGTVISGIETGQDWQRHGTMDLHLRLPDKRIVIMRHLLADPRAMPRVGKRIAQGELLGYEGNEGDGYHLHIEFPGINNRDPQAFQRMLQKEGFSGWARGGYTGDGDPLEPAGVVHKGEFVLPKHITDQWRPVLEGLQAGQAPQTTSTVRIVGEGNLRLFSADPADSSGTRLAALLNDAIGQFANEYSRGLNAPQRRGRSQ